MGCRRCIWVLAMLASTSCREQASGAGATASSTVSASAQRSAVLPPVADEWPRPTLKFESGSCWVRLSPLDQGTLSATKRAFEARNPGWEARVNRITGLVEEAHRSRDRGGAEGAAELSEDEYHLRALAVLRRNADFSGIPPADFAAFQWESTRGPAHGSARILCGDPGLRSIPKAEYCWDIGVFFDRDGVVNGFHTWQLGPPVGMCTRPTLSAEQAREVPWLRGKSPPPNLAFSQPGFVGPPREIGKARLVVDKYLQGTGATERSTWQLAWAVGINQAWSFHMDAVTGEPLGIQKHLLN